MRAADCLAESGAPRIADILLCGSDCVRCGACFGDAGDACAFEGASVADASLDASMEAAYSAKNDKGTMLDESSLAAEVADVFARHGFPIYAARSASETAVQAACEIWSPCRTDGSV